MANSSNELTVITCRIYRSTDKAYLIGEPGLMKTDTDYMEWIPRDLINHCKELPGNKVELEMPTWIVKKKELEYLED